MHGRLSETTRSCGFKGPDPSSRPISNPTPTIKWLQRKPGPNPSPNPNPNPLTLARILTLTRILTLILILTRTLILTLT